MLSFPGHPWLNGSLLNLNTCSPANLSAELAGDTKDMDTGSPEPGLLLQLELAG